MTRFLEKAVPVFSWFCGAVLLGAISSVAGYLLFRGSGTINLELIFGDTDPLAALLVQQQVFHGLFPGRYRDAVARRPVGLLGRSRRGGSGHLPGGIRERKDEACSEPLLRHPCRAAFHRHRVVRIQPGRFSQQAFLRRPPPVPSDIERRLGLSGVAVPDPDDPDIPGKPSRGNPEGEPRPGSTGRRSGIVCCRNPCRDCSAGSSWPSTCAEDTAVIMLTGAVASAGVPRTLLSHYEALPFYIYYVSAQYADQRELATAYGASIILLFLCLLLFSLAFLIKKNLSYLALNRA